MAGRRKNGEGSWGTKKIKGVEYKYFRQQFDGQDKYFYGKTEKEIKEKIKVFKESNSIIISKDIKKQTFGDYLLAWLTNIKQAELKRRTFDGYEDIVLNQVIRFKKYNITDKQMGSIDNECFQQYINALATQYARSSIRKLYVIMKQCLDYAKIRGDIKDNPLDLVKLPSEDIVAVKKKEIAFLTDDDMDKLYKESKRINEKGFNFGGKIGEPVYGNNAYAIVLLLHTGMRVSELLGLKYKDFDQENKCIYVRVGMGLIKNRNKKSDDENNYVLAETSTKTDSSVRRIPLSDKAIEMIKLLEQTKPKHTVEDNIALNQEGNILSARNLNRTLEAMLVRAKCSVEKCSIHSLRHSFGSYLARHGNDPKVVSEIMGHSDVSIFYSYYYHTIEDQKNEAIKSLNK